MSEIIVTGGELPQEEIDRYVEYVQRKNGYKEIEKLEIAVDGDFVNLTWTLKPESFQRIRRITGYLVGTMEQWNNAKVAEEQDRVKHL